MPSFSPYQETENAVYFRGTKIFYENIDIEKGNRIVLHDLPLSDKFTTQYLGRARRKWTISGFLIGDKLADDLKKLEAAAESQQAGELILPSGAVSVECQSCKINTTRNKIGYRSIELSFVEAAEELKAISIPKKAGFLDKIKGILAAIKNFVKQVRAVISQVSDFVAAVKDVIKTVGFIVKSVLAAVNAALQTIVDVVNVFKELEKTIDGIIKSPEQIASLIQNTIETVCNIISGLDVSNAKHANNVKNQLGFCDNIFKATSPNFYNNNENSLENEMINRNNIKETSIRTKENLINSKYFDKILQNKELANSELIEDLINLENNSIESQIEQEKRDNAVKAYLKAIKDIKVEILKIKNKKIATDIIESNNSNSQQSNIYNSSNSQGKTNKKELTKNNIQQKTFIFLTGLFLSEFAETIASISFSDPFFLVDKKEDIIKEYDVYIDLISEEDETGELEIAFRELKSSVFSILNTEQKEQKELYVKGDTDIFNFLYKHFGSINNLESIVKINDVNDCLNLKASTVIKV